MKNGLKPDFGQLNELAKEAIQQIIDKRYDAEISGKVIYIGLAHHHKDAVIHWQAR